MRFLFGLLAAVAVAFTGASDTFAGFGSSGYGSYAGYGSGVGYGSSGYVGYDSYYGYGSGGYAGYGSSGYGSSGYGNTSHHGHGRRGGLFARHRAKKAARHAGYGYGSSGYTSYSGYGSCGSSYAGYGSSGYSSYAGYGSSGSSYAGYGSSGYSSYAGYGSSGSSYAGYGSSGSSYAGYGSSGSSYYNAAAVYDHCYNAAYSATYGTAGYAAPATGTVYYGADAGVSSAYPVAAAPAVGAGNPAVEGPYPAPPGYQWVRRTRVVNESGLGTSPVLDPAPAVEGPYPAPPGYRWVRRYRSVPAGSVNPPAGVTTPSASLERTMNSDNASGHLITSVNSFLPTEIQLTIRVPESAKIFVNGNATTSTGNLRQFVARNLQPGGEYRFEVRAEDEIDGEKIVENKTVVLHSGQGEMLQFNLDADRRPIETILTLNVPAEADVTLAGNETATTGSQRVFRTKDLAFGQSWDDYTIRVSSGGVTKEKTIRLIAGDDLQVSFDFESELLASR